MDTLVTIANGGSFLVKAEKLEELKTWLAANSVGANHVAGLATESKPTTHDGKELLNG